MCQFQANYPRTEVLFENLKGAGNYESFCTLIMMMYNEKIVLNKEKTRVVFE